MQIIDIPIEKLKRDKNQPRTVFDPDRIKEMAQSIVTEKIINPIEIDPQFTIITGETRWRAAKVAGLKVVPCKVLELNPRNRFRRQVVENLQINSMTDWDTSKALAKLLNFAPSAKSQGKDQGISQLAREIGKSEAYIRSHLDRLEDSKPIQKALQAGTISFTHARELQEVPQEYRKQMEKKILAGEFAKSNSVTEVKSALSRNPEKAKEILAIDYSPLKSTSEVIEVISKISPRYYDQVVKALAPSEEFSRIKNDLLAWLKKHPPESILQKDRFLTILSMSLIVDKLNEWGVKANHKQLKERT